MYNYDVTMNYTNDFEFRMCIRKLFNMKMQKYDNEIDIISNDESNYDDESVTKVMDYIQLLTRNNTTFTKLYEMAATKMLSTDRSIGLSVLFSYDYAKDFHACLCAFKDSPAEFNETHPAYIALRIKIK